MTLENMLYRNTSNGSRRLISESAQLKKGLFVPGAAGIVSKEAKHTTRRDHTDNRIPLVDISNDIASISEKKGMARSFHGLYRLSLEFMNILNTNTNLYQDAMVELSHITYPYTIKNKNGQWKDRSPFQLKVSQDGKEFAKVEVYFDAVIVSKNGKDTQCLDISKEVSNALVPVFVELAVMKNVAIRLDQPIAPGLIEAWLKKDSIVTTSVA